MNSVININCDISMLPVMIDAHVLQCVQEAAQVVALKVSAEVTAEILAIESAKMYVNSYDTNLY